MRSKRWAVLALLLSISLTACGSSKSSSTPVSTGGPCPFSGATSPQNQAGSTNGTQLTKASATTSGCIDNVTFTFSPTLAASQTAYQSGSTTVLTVRFQGATLGPNVKAGPVSDLHNLNYVKSVEVSAPSGAVEITITLGAQQQFLVSASQVPPQLQLAIG
jgi:hypothetical protein